MAHGKWCGSLEMWWLIGNGVVHWRCGGSLEMDKWCGSVEMWWLIGNGVVHWRCGGP